MGAGMRANYAKAAFVVGTVLLLLYQTSSPTPSSPPPSDDGVYLGPLPIPRHLRRVIIQHTAACAESGPKPPSFNYNSTLPKTSVVHTQVVGLRNTSRTGEAVSFVLIARSDKGATCLGGDYYEVSAWSDSNRVPVRIYSAGYGAYYGTFTPRVGGVFKLCVYHYIASRVGHGLASHVTLLKANDTGYELGEVWKRMGVVTKEVVGLPVDDWCTSHKAETEPQCHYVSVEGPPVLPQKKCGRQWSTSLTGSWVRAKGAVCTPGICEGDLPFMASDRWVYVPDECYLRLYNTEAAWQCIDRKKVLIFGDSTTKQPAHDLVEMVLRVPTLTYSFRWQMKNCPPRKRPKGCDNPFAHRQWAANRTNPMNTSQSTVIRFVWGGGPKVYHHPRRTRPNGLALLLNGTYPRRAYRKKTRLPRYTFVDFLAEVPDMVVIHAYLWDVVAQSSSEAHWVQVKAVLDEVQGKTPPTTAIHIASSHALCLDDRVNEPVKVCVSSLRNKLQSVVAWQHHNFLKKKLREYSAGNPRLITLGDRYSMSFPYVAGTSYCHFGIHFGAHPQFCHVWDPINPKRCARSWLVDKYESQMWLNALCPDDVPLPTTGNGTVEDGVAYDPPGGTANLPAL